MPKAKSNSKSSDKASTLQVAATAADMDKVLAQTVLRPSVRAAMTLQQWSTGFGVPDLTQLVDELSTQAKSASEGNLARGEAMLMAQAHTLDAIFNELARRAALNMGEYLNACETYLRLALKAQSQCRATMETLALMKNPTPTTFVRQANIANTQQVNNGAPAPTGNARARETENPPNKLLEATDGERLDFGTAPAPSRADSPLEAVEPIHRPANGDR